ncbi:hypothetical protein NQ036_04665 [Brevibacterium sp. 91QC2O2]|uniref:hypothetical protein n=1 Tax=Brevibacterium sp. 91QC2O2 TaxID=2968458 RepID=UPI00211CCD1D|nr:hypothetical protein [Brevibacterium sp. 91QC2O2]MCQ9367544.1 hypothetical protein [Brevibacterium sp. 91QC2O2]
MDTDVMDEDALLRGYRLGYRLAMITMGLVSVLAAAIGLRLWSIVPVVLLMIVALAFNSGARSQGLDPRKLERPSGPAQMVVQFVVCWLYYLAFMGSWWFEKGTGRPLLDTGLIVHHDPDPDAVGLEQILMSCSGFILITGWVFYLQWRRAKRTAASRPTSAPGTNLRNTARADRVMPEEEDDRRHRLSEEANSTEVGHDGTGR